MKKKTTNLFIILGILTSAIVFLVGIGVGATLASWGVFFSYLIASLSILFGTAFFWVILMSLCEIVDELKLINQKLSKTTVSDILEENTDNDDKSI